MTEMAQAELQIIVKEKPQDGFITDMPMCSDGKGGNIYARLHYMKIHNGERVYVQVPLTKEKNVIEDAGDEAYKYFDCHSYALGLWSTKHNSGYVFYTPNNEDRSLSVSSVKTTLMDPGLFEPIRDFPKGFPNEFSEDIKQSGKTISSGDIITFWNDKGTAVHSVKIAGNPEYLDYKLHASTMVFSKNGLKEFDPNKAVKWGDIKTEYAGIIKGPYSLTVFHPVQNPWWKVSDGVQ